MQILKTVGTVVLMAAWLWMGTVMLVAMLDPDCGPDGNSQRECIKQINADLVAAVSGGAR
jgi:hypothetical protein